MEDTQTDALEIVSQMTELEFVAFLENLKEFTKKNRWSHLVEREFGVSIDKRTIDVKHLIDRIKEIESDLDSASSDMDDHIRELKKLLPKE